MPDLRIPQPSLDINNREKVKPTGTQVSRVTWNPQQGLDRETEIEQARQAAHEAYKKQLEDSTAIGVRVSRLENEIKTISGDIAKILQLLGAKDVQHQS
jgi:tRNA G26 N,N-dimethylase Trm1